MQDDRTTLRQRDRSANKTILGILLQQQQQHVLLVYWTFYRSAGLGHSVNTAAIKVVCTGNKVKRET